MYDIMLDQNIVGRAEVQKDGLFLVFKCECSLTNRGIYRISVSDGNVNINLGVCVPQGDRFVALKRIAAKRIKGAQLSFSLISNKEACAENLIPIANDTQFAYIEKLEAARLQIANGQPTILIDSAPNQQDNDPNRTHSHI